MVGTGWELCKFMGSIYQKKWNVLDRITPNHFDQNLNWDYIEITDLTMPLKGNDQGIYIYDF